MPNDPYEALAKRMDKFPIGAPLTDQLLAILRELFTVEEATLALALPGRASPAPTIAAQVSQPVERVTALLEDLASRGLVYCGESKGVRVYSLLPIVRIDDLNTKGRLTPVKTRVAQLFDEYSRNGLAEAKHHGTPWSRVLTVEQAIPSEVEVFPYERVSEVIKTRSSFALATCNCREKQELLGRACGAPKEVCMTFGSFAEYLIERNFARRSTQDEMLRALDLSEAAGLVHTTDNVVQNFSYVCNCCGCCCGALAGINKLNRLESLAKSKFIARIVDSECIGCEACVTRCQVSALAVPEQTAIVDQQRCIGCGLCTSACPTSAIEMRARDVVNVPFQSLREVEARLMAERGLV